MMGYLLFFITDHWPIMIRKCYLKLRNLTRLFFFSFSFVYLMYRRKISCSGNFHSIRSIRGLMTSANWRNSEYLFIKLRGVKVYVWLFGDSNPWICKPAIVSGEEKLQNLQPVKLIHCTVYIISYTNIKWCVIY
jgi:hypothetical protein